MPYEPFFVCYLQPLPSDVMTASLATTALLVQQSPAANQFRLWSAVQALILVRS